MTRIELEKKLSEACIISGTFEADRFNPSRAHWYDFSNKRVVVGNSVYVQPYDKAKNHTIVPCHVISHISLVPKDTYTLVFLTLVSGLDIEL
jgi:hypothetical protein